jgi:CubicO group peptidase (beta-lactamase class C family)
MRDVAGVLLPTVLIPYAIGTVIGDLAPRIAKPLASIARALKPMTKSTHRFHRWMKCVSRVPISEFGDPDHRSGYAYDNLLYVVAGEVAAVAGGASYEELVRREVFQPFGLSCRVGEWRRDEITNTAQPHMRKDGHNVVINADTEVVPAITSAAAGGIRCSLNDMLAWARNWLDPDEKGLAWLSAEQRRPLWTAHTPMPISARRREWDHAHFYAYGYGWRLTDVDNVWNVSHTGTLSGMYSVLSLLPDKRSAFVMLTNGEGSDARTVLTEVLLKHFTSAAEHRRVAEYADAIAHEPAAPAHKAPDTSSRLPLTASQAQRLLGVWRDPWFGEASVCMRGDTVRFASANRRCSPAR